MCVSAKKPPILYANHFLNKNIFANLLINVVFFCAIITFKKILLKKFLQLKMLLGLSRNIKKKKYIEAHCGCGLRENVGCTGCVTDMRQEINHNVKAMLNM